VKKDARAIVVLGMHRGGTSVLAKALQTLGVSVGESFLDPNEWNPKGYFEHPDIVRLNDTLLGLVGKRWDSLALPPWEEWQQSAEPYQIEALEILERDFGGTAICGIKDPRTSRLLPFWQSVFRRAKLQDCYIVALRNPISVARSLAARDGFTPEKSYLLWVQHQFAAIRDTENLARTVVDYDALIANPEAELGRIATFLEISVTRAIQRRFADYSETFLSDSLRHSVHNPMEVRDDPRAGELVGNAYDLLRRLAQDTISTPQERRSFTREWRALGQVLHEAAPMLRYLDACENQIDALTLAPAVALSIPMELPAAETSIISADEIELTPGEAVVQVVGIPTAPLSARSDVRVSVVIPLYNHERYIATAIESVFAQTVHPAEIIIIDDGSTDGSFEKVRQLCRDRPDVIFWSWPNQGAHHTLNAAIYRATGDFVAILNSDDRYDPERLAACLSVVQSHPTVDVVATEISFIDEKGRAMASRWYDDALAFYKESGNLSLALCNANFLMTTSNLFIRRAAFEAVGYFSPLRYTHDLEFFLRLLLAKKTIHFLARPLLTYRFHSGNTIAESRAGTDVERAAVLAFFLYRRGLAEGATEEGDTRLRQCVQVLMQQGIAEMVEYFLALLEGKPRKKGPAVQDSAAGELRGVLSRLGIGSAGPESRNSLFTQFVAARNNFLRKADAVSMGMSKHAAEISRLHGVLAEKDRGLQEQGAEIHRINAVLVAKEDALSGLTVELHRINAVLAAKEEALSGLTVELHRINAVLAAKEEALSGLTAELHRINAVLAAKEEELSGLTAELHRINAVLVTKDEALTALTTEIHRVNSVIVAKDEALTALSAEIQRINAVLVAKDAALIEQAAELHRINHVLVAKDRALTERATEIDRLRGAVAERTRVESEHRETIRLLSIGMEEQLRAAAELTKQHHMLAAGMTEKERELASLRQSSWYKLGQAWDKEGLTLGKVGSVTYHLMQGVTPESWKRPVRPLVARLKRRYQLRDATPQVTALLPLVNPETRPPRPRVLHVIANFMLGGSSRLVVDLIEGLGEAYEQKVVTSFLPTPPAYEGIAVTEFRSPHSPEDVLPFLREYCPALVHFHYWGDCDFSWYDIFFRAVRTLGCRVIENVNTPVHPYHADFVDRYVYVSNYVQSSFGDENSSRNLTIHPGSDFSLFSRRGNRQLPSDCIGMVYRLENDKLNEQSIDALIKVAQRRPQTKVIIVGGGTFLEPYRQAAKQAGVESNFVFTGYIDYSMLPELYEQMTIFVAPVWKESFGQVSAFAMSMGIPVAGYNVGGLAEVVDDASLLAEAGNSEELATLVIQLLDDPERCRRIGARGRDRALALFSVEAMLDAYRSVYGELLGVPE